MNLVQMLQEGGLGAYAAIALGFVGTLLGFLAITLALNKSSAAFGAGIATLVLADFTAMVGIGGTLWGRMQAEQVLAYVESAVDGEHIMLLGWREAANCAVFGGFGALLPFLLGGAAAFIGAKAPTPRRMQGVPEVVSTDASSGRVVLATVFGLITLISLGGAWFFAQQKPPPGRYGLDPMDRAAWQLASALEAVSKQEPRGCSRLHEALEPYWGATDRKEWPRVMRREVPPALTPQWKTAARACVEERLQRHADVGELLTSPLLQEDELREKVQTDGAIPSLPPPDDGLDKASIARVVRTARQTIQDCYERALVRAPKLEGRVEIEFTIDGRGDVSDANASAGTTLKNAKVVSCVREAIEHLRFPAPSDGEPLTVKYPFVLSPAP